MADFAPLPQPAPAPQAESRRSVDLCLWRDAPEWRNLILAAIGFTAAVLTLPLVDTPGSQLTTAPACQGGYIYSPERTGTGTVARFLTQDEALRWIQETQLRSRMAINPDYISNARILVQLDGHVSGTLILYVVPQGMNIRVGDRVQVESGRVDPDLPCHYIPNHVVSAP